MSKRKSTIPRWEIEKWISKALKRGVDYSYSEVLKKVTEVAAKDKGRSFKKMRFTVEFGKHFDQLVEEEKILLNWDKKLKTATYRIPMTKEERKKMEMILVAFDLLKTDG